MPKHTFLERLAAGELLVADGATGTNLQERGLTLGAAPEEWIFGNPAAPRFH
jgi:methionine synthase I (cobalamin-dependent)